jgi:hypothetical protein
MGQPGVTSTIAENFLAPAGSSVTLNDFSLVSDWPLQTVANIHLRAFVFAWTGILTNGGGRASGNPLYLGPSFIFSPPPRGDVWVPLTANFGATGVTLDSGQPYVVGFTMSNPTDFRASQGYISFQFVDSGNPNYNPPSIPRGVDLGSGSAVWLNNSNNFAALNTSIWTTGVEMVMAFTAHFTVVPEPSTFAIAALGVATCTSTSAALKRRPTRKPNHPAS